MTRTRGLGRRVGLQRAGPALFYAGRIMLWPLVWLGGLSGMLFPWVPVFLAMGIALWFGLPVEPSSGLRIIIGLGMLAAFALAWFGPGLLHPPAVALALIALGFLAAGVRAHLVSAPVLGFRYYGPIEGRVIEVDRSGSDALRITLDRVVLNNVAPDRLPAKVRVSLHGAQRYHHPQPGQVVQVTGHLAPSEGPVEPGGFDFRRMAWFMQLGAVGYSRNPLLLLSEPEPQEQWINRIRSWLSAGIRARIPGDAGAFASGVMTGDRSGLSLDAVEDLRASSLAHILAISGMNLAFLIGFVFALFRTGVALIPPLALRVDARKISAAISLVVAWFYLMLSGSNIATERAFLMVCVMLGAMLLDRRALSLRSVALAGVILLLLRPESLYDAGFQMSFAATVALIAGFRAVEGGILRRRIPRWCAPLFTLVLSSLIGGIATGPFGAAHFNRIADFGFLANLLTVPVMGAVIMPAGAVAALAAPFGLADLPLWVMGLGCSWILYIADLVAGWDGSVTFVPAPGPWVLPVMTLGGVMLVLARNRMRLAGLGVICLSFVLWTQASRPAFLIAPEAQLVGISGPEGRALSAPRGAGFAARNWLEKDGDSAVQAVAAARPGFEGPENARRFQFGAWRGVHLRGSKAPQALQQACADADLVIIAARLRDRPAGCVVIDQSLMAATGSLSLRLEGEKLIATPARQSERPWLGPRRGVPARLEWDLRPVPEAQ